MCVKLLDGVQHHFANAARVTTAQACNTKQKTDSDLNAERKETSPSWNTLKIVLSHFSFSLEHYWLLFVFEIALADKEQRNLYLIPVVSLLSTWQGFCLKTPFSVCQIKKTHPFQIWHFILQSSWNQVLAILASFCPDSLLIWGVMLRDGLLQWRGAKCIGLGGSEADAS